jgi:hypothetical protein
MSKEDLSIYLNDHLAGSVGALELLDHLIETYKGKPLGPRRTGNSTLGSSFMKRRPNGS